MAEPWHVLVLISSSSFGISNLDLLRKTWCLWLFVFNILQSLLNCLSLKMISQLQHTLPDYFLWTSSHSQSITFGARCRANIWLDFFLSLKEMTFKMRTCFWLFHHIFCPHASFKFYYDSLNITSWKSSLADYYLLILQRFVCQCDLTSASDVVKWELFIFVIKLLMK